MKPLRLSLNDIKNAYKGVKAQAIEAFYRGDYERSMEYVRHCATIAQQFNWIYTDDELEELLKNIALKIIPQAENDYTPVKDRVVLYDDFCVSFILALQYVDALVAAGKELLYITFNQQSGKFSSIIPIIQSKYPNVRIVNLAKNSIIQGNIDFYQEILNFRPEQILLHVFANTIIIPALHALPKVTSKYIINLADQTFWLGAKVVDYVLEFRQFGVSVSQQRRGIKPAMQLLVPFYPIVDNNPFQGFPKECTEEGEVLIFSGGDIYKVLDEKRMYWHLVKRVLDTFPEVVFLFATKIDGIGMEYLNSFIHDNNYEGRFVYTKFRPDINEVLAHVDIFMGTCPVCGSLMSQLAARNATPILQYYYPGTPDNETEQAICINEQFSISLDNEEAFMQEAEKLIYDVEYRKQQGKRLQRAMITENQFNELVKNTLATNKTQIPLQPYRFDYQQLDDRWFALEKAGYISSMSYLYGMLGKNNCLRFAPKILIKKHLNTLINILNK
jgi:hypothetical protein